MAIPMASESLSLRGRGFFDLLMAVSKSLRSRLLSMSSLMDVRLMFLRILALNCCVFVSFGLSLYCFRACCKHSLISSGVDGLEECCSLAIQSSSSMVNETALGLSCGRREVLLFV